MFYWNEMSVKFMAYISVGVKAIYLFLCRWSIASGRKSAVFTGFFLCFTEAVGTFIMCKDSSVEYVRTNIILWIKYLHYEMINKKSCSKHSTTHDNQQYFR